MNKKEKMGHRVSREIRHQGGKELYDHFVDLQEGEMKGIIDSRIHEVYNALVRAFPKQPTPQAEVINMWLQSIIDDCPEWKPYQDTYRKGEQIIKVEEGVG